MFCKVVIPSRKRAHIFETKIDGAIVVVDKSEYESYRENLDCEIVCHNGLKNLSSIRNWILNYFGDTFMVDDDIVSVERLYDTTNQELSPVEVFQLIQETYYASLSVGSFLFGFNNDPSPTHFNMHKPIMLNGYINGSSFGIIGDNLRFDERTVACESHYINLLNAYINRFCYIDKRFHFRQKTDSTFLLEGGQSGKRTASTEKQDTLFLRRMFGESVILKKEQNKTKQLHQYQRQLKIRL